MTYDLILAGGGLANGLIAWRLQQQRPDLKVLCIEEQPHLGGNHTWSFHDGDLSEAQHRWLEPLVVKRWASYQVHFPYLSRAMDSGYASITGEHFADVITPALGSSLRLNSTISEISPTHVLLESGERLEARATGIASSPTSKNTTCRACVKTW